MLRDIAQKRKNVLKNQRATANTKQDARRKTQTKKMEALFKALFAELLPHIKKEGIDIVVRPNPFLSFSCYVVFEKNGRQWRMELTKSGTWRYRPDQTFGQWPKEDLAVALVDNLLN